jgi:hypothetical protein
MLRLEAWMDIHLLCKQGHSIRAIDLTGRARNTVRKALRQKMQQPFAAPNRRSKLDNFKACVEQRYSGCGPQRLSATGRNPANGLHGVDFYPKGIRAVAEAGEEGRRAG